MAQVEWLTDQLQDSRHYWSLLPLSGLQRRGCESSQELLQQIYPPFQRPLSHELQSDWTSQANLHICTALTKERSSETPGHYVVLNTHERVQGSNTARSSLLLLTQPIYMVPVVGQEATYSLRGIDNLSHSGIRCRTCAPPSLMCIHNCCQGVYCNKVEVWCKQKWTTRD